MLNYTTFFNVTGYANVTGDTGCYDTTYLVTVFWTQMLVNITNTFYLILCSPQNGCPLDCLSIHNNSSCIASINNPKIGDETISIDLHNDAGMYVYVYGFSHYTPIDFRINNTRVVTPIYCPSSPRTDILPLWAIFAILVGVSCSMPIFILIYNGISTINWSEVWLKCKQCCRTPLNTPQETYVTFNDDPYINLHIDNINSNISISHNQMKSFNVQN